LQVFPAYHSDLRVSGRRCAWCCSVCDVGDALWAADVENFQNFSHAQRRDQLWQLGGRRFGTRWQLVVAAGGPKEMDLQYIVMKATVRREVLFLKGLFGKE